MVLRRRTFTDVQQTESTRVEAALGVLLRSRYDYHVLTLSWAVSYQEELSVSSSLLSFVWQLLVVA